MIELEDIHRYYKDRLDELTKYASEGDPWVFILLAAFIEYMVKITSNKDETNSNDYKDFIKHYLSLVNVQYRDFTFNQGTQDLPAQMYHTLRCGVIHSFSMIPDKISTKYGGRPRSILLAHRKNGKIHLSVHIEDGMDSVIFTAEDFLDDIKKLVEVIFIEKATNDANLKNNIIDWFNKYQPIGIKLFPT
ncbi:MAG: hypothetical protein IT270_14765 [Saprospiraceae bacterium]|nr:hypothetical protein [Saprospiraceae bacterium]